MQSRKALEKKKKRKIAHNRNLSQQEQVLLAASQSFFDNPDLSVPSRLHYKYKPLPEFTKTSAKIRREAQQARYDLVINTVVVEDQGSHGSLKSESRTTKAIQKPKSIFSRQLSLSRKQLATTKNADLKVRSGFPLPSKEQPQAGKDRDRVDRMATQTSSSMRDKKKLICDILEEQVIKLKHERISSPTEAEAIRRQPVLAMSTAKREDSKSGFNLFGSEDQDSCSSIADKLKIRKFGNL